MARTNITRSVCWPCSSNLYKLLLPEAVCLGLLLGYISATLGVGCEWWGGVISVTCWHWTYFPLFAECRETKSGAFLPGQISGSWGYIFHPLWRKSKWFTCRWLMECISPICFGVHWDFLFIKLCLTAVKETKEHGLRWAKRESGAIFS